MTQGTIPQEVWDHEVTASAPQPIDWLGCGFVAGGNLTLLTSQWKEGKTTLLSRRKEGGQLAGLTVKPGKSRTGKGVRRRKGVRNEWHFLKPEMPGQYEVTRSAPKRRTFGVAACAKAFARARKRGSPAP